MVVIPYGHFGTLRVRFIWFAFFEVSECGQDMSARRRSLEAPWYSKFNH